MTTFDKSLFQSVVNMIDHLAASGNYEMLENLLALLCLFSILNRNQSQQTSSIAGAPANAGSPLQKLLGELTKGGDGGGGLGGLGSLGGLLGGALGSTDMLSTLLPLLNSPQLKSKLNPSNISSIMGIINNLSGGLNNHEKPDPGKQKTDKITPDKKPETASSVPETIKEPASKPEPAIDSPSAIPAAEPKLVSPVETLVKETPPPDGEKKSHSRFLNWKTNF